ncbi:helix-turn-helix domain-containing protein [Streptomyces chrestomyceticus]|uniref:helix-turn-helix domain-containing protein n=1 Tax=Streptomyces chrestomyceticus TaxID=68185 RepID=UPI00340E44C1
MTSLNDNPRDLPPALLRDAEFTDACRVRNFGRVFQLMARRAGVSQVRVAFLCGLTPSRVSEVAAGRRNITNIDVIERISDGLRIPGAMLGLAHRTWELPPKVIAAPSSPVPPPSGGESVPAARRSADLDDVLAITDDARVTPSAVSALRTFITDYWRQDDAHGGALLRPAVIGQLRHVQRLLRRDDGRGLKADLKAIEAELARLAGWASFDAQQYSKAQAYFTEALESARDSGDRQFAANVLSCMSLQATYEQEANEAVSLAHAAQDAARNTHSPALVMSMLYMREAFAQAVLRDGAACERAVARAHLHFERSNGQEAPPWVRYFDETKLLVDTGIAYAQLGKSREAERLIAEGLRRENDAQQRGNQQRGRAFHAFWLASTRLQHGDLPQACDAATMALDLASAINSPRITAHVRDFHAQLRPYARETPVIAFEAHMRKLLA